MHSLRGVSSVVGFRFVGTKRLSSQFVLVRSLSTARVLGMTVVPKSEGQPQASSFDLTIDSCKISVSNASSGFSAVESLADSGLSPRILKRLSSAAIVKPSPIQAIAWPIARSGKSLIGISKTGSGKTLGFGLPAIEAAARKGNVSRSPAVLVVAPTRELVNQIYDHLEPYAALENVKVVRVFGGVGRGPQIDELRRGTGIVIGTPGRLLDLKNERAVVLDNVDMMVIDEADNMLDMGFMPQLTKIGSACQGRKQTLFWSATWPDEVQSLCRNFMRGNSNDPVVVRAGSAGTKLNEDVDQQAIAKNFGGDREAKLNALSSWLNSDAVTFEGKMMIFTQTKRMADWLHRCLLDLEDTLPKLRSEVIHGDKSQDIRDRAIKAFRDGRKGVNTLVATDVAARGIDVSQVDWVVNFDCPKNVDSFIHRTGRTARAGRKGSALTLIDTSVDLEVKMAGEIASLIKETGKPVPDSLDKFASGDRVSYTRHGKSESRDGRRGSPRSYGSDRSHGSERSYGSDRSYGSRSYDRSDSFDSSRSRYGSRRSSSFGDDSEGSRYDGRSRFGSRSFSDEDGASRRGRGYESRGDSNSARSRKSSGSDSDYYDD